MTIKELRALAFLKLNAELTEVPPEVQRLEADALICYQLGLSREELFSRSSEVVGDVDILSVYDLLKRRAKREPIAYIVCEKEFYSYPFIVEPGVLVPRPETEILVSAVMEFLSSEQNEVREKGFFVCEVGVGSGAVLLSIVMEARRLFDQEVFSNSLFVGSDISAEALRVAKKNALKFELGDKLMLFQGNLADAIALEAFGARRSVLLSNPPYIPEHSVLPRDVSDYEPHQALYSGPHGLDSLRLLIERHAPFLRSHSLQRLILEFGQNQDHDIECLCKAEGLKNYRFIEDLQGIRRAVVVAP